MNNVFDVQCKVCAIDVTADTDGRLSFFSGTLTFGPNQKVADINETFIINYKVYLVDTNGVKVNNTPLATVGASQASEEACCQFDLYTVTIEGADMVTNTASALMVVPVDTMFLEMPYGQIATITDMTTTTTTTGTIVTNTATTLTATTTSTLATIAPDATVTETTMTTTTTLLITEVVSGVLGMTVENKDAFCAAADALKAVSEGIAALVLMPAKFIDSVCAPTARRLGDEDEDQHGMLRRLADAVDIDYSITVPQSGPDAAGITVSTAQVTSAITSSTPAQFTSAIAAKITAAAVANPALSAFASSITVATVSAPTVTQATYTATTTTATVMTVTITATDAPGAATTTTPVGPTVTATATETLQAGIDSMARRHVGLAVAHVLALLVPAAFLVN